MADEIRTAVQHYNVDARKLWLPVGVVAALLVAVSGALIGAGMWIRGVNDRTASTTELAAEVKSVNTKMDTMQGQLMALMSMQATVAQTSAEVGAIKSRMDGFETRLQTQDAWIQTTRDRLREQGFPSPTYKPGGD